MKKAKKKLKKENKDAWMRLPIGIVSGAIIYVWSYLIGLFFIINIVNKIISGKRLEELSKMSEVWNTQNYHFIRYMTFCSNRKPFPFDKLREDLNKIDNL
jgi:hypothetical protein